MGNCFKTSTRDDISLLRDSDVPENGESGAPVVPPPPYQVSIFNCVQFNSNEYKGINTFDVVVVFLYCKCQQSPILVETTLVDSTHQCCCKIYDVGNKRT